MKRSYSKSALKLFYVGLLSLLCDGKAIAQHYQLTSEGTEILFYVRNFGLKVEGRFTGAQGEIVFDPMHPSISHFSVSIPVATISTGIGLRDKHLKKEEYFDVEHFPMMNFESSTVSFDATTGQGELAGDLTIKGITRHVVFSFSVTQGLQAAPVFESAFELNRRKYNVGGSSFSLSDEVLVRLKVQTLRMQQP